MIRVARIRKNSDGTWTIRVGRQVEHIDSHGKTPGEIFEAIRWALISKGLVLDEIEVLYLMYEERGV